MSNRIIAFFVLLFVVITGVVGVWWFFMAANATLEVRVHGSGATTVRLQKAGADMLVTHCSDVCAIKEIPPFSYDLSVERDGYKSYTENVTFARGAAIQRDVTLARDVALIPYHTSNTASAIAGIKARNALLSETGAEQREVLATIGSGTYYLDRNSPPKLLVRTDTTDTLLLELPYTASGIRTITDPSDGLLLLDTGKDRILYDVGAHHSEYTNLPSGARTIARFDANTLKFVTDSGAYLLAHGSQTPLLHPLYDDFITIDGVGVLALIRSTSASKKRLANFPEDQDTLILLDEGNGKRTVLLRTTESIVALDRDEGTFLALDADGNKYSITHLPTPTNGN